MGALLLIPVTSFFFSQASKFEVFLIEIMGSAVLLFLCFVCFLTVVSYVNSLLSVMRYTEISHFDCMPLQGT